MTFYLNKKIPNFQIGSSGFFFVKNGGRRNYCSTAFASQIAEPVNPQFK